MWWVNSDLFTLPARAHEHFYSHENFISLLTVPPDRPIIFDAIRKQKASNVEAYNEGSDVVLICEVTGGKFSFDLSSCKISRAIINISVVCNWLRCVGKLQTMFMFSQSHSERWILSGSKWMRRNTDQTKFYVEHQMSCSDAGSTHFHQHSIKLHDHIPHMSIALSPNNDNNNSKTEHIFFWSEPDWRSRKNAGWKMHVYS